MRAVQDHPLQPARRSERGFTLIEMVAAGFVLVLASLGLGAAIAHGSRMTETPRERALAREALDRVRAELEAAPYCQAAAQYNGTGFDVPGLEALPDDTDGQPGEISFAYGPGGDTSSYTVTIRVRWRSRSGPQELEIVHVLGNIRGESGTPAPLVRLERRWLEPVRRSEPMGI